MKKLFLSTVAALALSATGALAETIIRDGCEWRKAENSNYFVRVNPGCKIGHNGNGSPPPVFLEPEEPGEDDEDPGNGDGGEDPGTDPEEPAPVDPGEGEEPGGGDDEGQDPGTGGEDDGNDEGGDKPTKPGHGHGDDNHDHSGPPGQNKPKPGKGPKG